MQEEKRKKEKNWENCRYHPEEKCEELIRHIKKLCDDRGMSYYALAKDAEVSPSTLHELLSGKTKPYLYTVYKLCNALDVSMMEILGENMVLENTGDLNKKEKELLLLYRKCSRTQKEHLEMYLKMLKLFCEEHASGK
ncbi:helix-turn-helix domain-containing protein [Blautia sp. MSJ-19]|uniref:helix-turn-helix domain-containing protein n=1 Tax=Blautia sp. MSJ-19 TaxID=2841517 RepID=UPI001C0EBCD5|nr:helix-turn-helix transcriptional regulator [Blautia sp. MSJ-19]MBU5481548.1 helix-turn-helix transcriptional regulator [Blautia sp. MSJ-19]